MKTSHLTFLHALAVSALLFAPACNGTAISPGGGHVNADTDDGANADDGADEGSPAPETPDKDPSGAGICAGAGGGSPTTGTPGRDTFSATELQAAAAKCDLDHGPVNATPTAGDYISTLTHAWLQCAPNATVFPSAVVFRSDGTYQHLKGDGAGGLVPQVGLDGAGTWDFIIFSEGKESIYPDVTCDMKGTITQFDLHPMPNSGIPCKAAFEASPDRLRIQSYNSTGWFVRLDP